MLLWVCSSRQTISHNKPLLAAQPGWAPPREQSGIHGFSKEAALHFRKKFPTSPVRKAHARASTEGWKRRTAGMGDSGTALHDVLHHECSAASPLQAERRKATYWWAARKGKASAAITEQSLVAFKQREGFWGMIVTKTAIKEPPESEL